MGRNGTPISHLMFADDLLLVCEAEVEQISVVMGMLEEFGLLLGQKDNKQKSSLFFSRNVDTHTQHTMCEVSGFKRTLIWVSI